MPETSRVTPASSLSADPAGELAAVAERDLDQPVVVAAPVARLGERAVDAARGDLEGVGRLAHQVGVVEHAGDRAGRLGDVVEGDAAVLVDGDPQHAPLAGGRQLDGLEIEAEHGQRVAERICDPGAVRTDLAHDATSCAVVVAHDSGCAGPPTAAASPGRPASLGDRVAGVSGSPLSRRAAAASRPVRGDGSARPDRLRPRPRSSSTPAARAAARPRPGDRHRRPGRAVGPDRRGSAAGTGTAALVAVPPRPAGRARRATRRRPRRRSRPLTPAQTVARERRAAEPVHPVGGDLRERRPGAGAGLDRRGHPDAAGAAGRVVSDAAAVDGAPADAGGRARRRLRLRGARRPRGRSSGAVAAAAGPRHGVRRPRGAPQPAARRWSRAAGGDPVAAEPAYALPRALDHRRADHGRGAARRARLRHDVRRAGGGDLGRRPRAGRSTP